MGNRDKNENGIPVIAFAAYSGNGKTTLIAKVIQKLKERGLRVAVIKHDGHDFEIDHEGKDSWRFSKAGADISIVSSAARTAYIEQRPMSLEDLIGMVHDVDLILIEGFKREPLTQIGICRKAAGTGFTADLSRYVAVVTDLTDLTAEEIWNLGGADRQPGGMDQDGPKLPQFGLDDIDEITEFIMENRNDFTHFNEQGRAKMVNVGEKDVTHRTAVAGARVLVSQETFEKIRSGGMKKGDVLTVAQIAGVMGAKKTSDLIPMCHPVAVSGIDLCLTLDESRLAVDIQATVSCDGKTGVEMEALTAVSTAALTVYDMCKAVQKDIVISDIRLIEKTGGIHGDFHREER